MIRIALWTFLVFLPLVLIAQKPHKPSSAEIFDAIKKAQVLGSVLYVAAHPDDENTSLISYFANHRHFHTTYLSLTRGDGGQNLVGTEISELLGLIRTQELLAARAIDGGNQLFSRAIDFGYSKSPSETFAIWNKDEVFADVVWAIRKTRPDIIVNRFDHRTKGTTHGHHTGSAILSYEAFSKSGDESVFREQLEYVEPWEPSRQFFNTSWFFYGSRDAFEKADKSNRASVDIGVFYPTRGKSNSEISALSRSSHKSQGFGATGSRGSQQEYLELIQGDPITPQDDPFLGINTSWSRINGGEKIGKMLAAVEEKYDLANPSASIPDLIAVYKAIQKIPDDHFWVPKKLGEIKNIIAWCAGIFIEATASDFTGTPGQEVNVNIEAINRSPKNVSLVNWEITPGNMKSDSVLQLKNNIRFRTTVNYQIPKNADYSTPYWLVESGTVGLFGVKDQSLRGLPEGERPCYLKYLLNIEGLSLEYETPLVFKRNDRVDGEVYRPFEISPPVFLNFQDETLVFGDAHPRSVNLTVVATKDSLEGKVSLNAPLNWGVSPPAIDVKLTGKGQEETVSFTVVPPAEAGTFEIGAEFTSSGAMYNYGATVIEYDHIPTQTILKQALAKAVTLELSKNGNQIGYIMGAGDKVPEFLSQIGYDVTMLTEDDLTEGNLSTLDAVIVGIRAYNTNDRLKFFNKVLFDYVENGGNLILQYNTSSRWGNLNSEDFSPYPLKISRDRVTDENAEVRILAPDHPAIKGPNPITSADFEGWVQERGLYFPDEWDDKFTPILSCNDPGEDPKNGSLLVAQYGKGWYVYSGLSWFRELPAGVPGAYRLLANLISLGKNSEP